MRGDPSHEESNVDTLGKHKIVTGHYQDSIPSLDHYGFMRTGINYMLLSTLDDERGSVLLFPSWPSVRTPRYRPLLLRMLCTTHPVTNLHAPTGQVERALQAPRTTQHYNRSKLSRGQARVSSCRSAESQSGYNCD